LAPLELVACAAPRAHCPVVAVSVPDGLTVHPVLVSSVSDHTVVPPVPQYWACLPVARYGQSAYSLRISTASRLREVCAGMTSSGG
jgi:hypothetical protein